MHDVDLLPQNWTIPYECDTKTDQPYHLSVAITKFKYKFHNTKMIGGVSAFSSIFFDKINGYSNKFWGWGGEDDNLFYRLDRAGYKINRPKFECDNLRNEWLVPEISGWMTNFTEKQVEKRSVGKLSENTRNCAKWQMIKHAKESENRKNPFRSKTVKIIDKTDGLSDCNYKIVKFEARFNGLFNYILLDLDAPTKNTMNNRIKQEWGTRLHVTK